MKDITNFFNKFLDTNKTKETKQLISDYLYRSQEALKTYDTNRSAVHLQTLITLIDVQVPGAYEVIMRFLRRLHVHTTPSEFSSLGITLYALAVGEEHIKKKKYSVHALHGGLKLSVEYHLARKLLMKRGASEKLIDNATDWVCGLLGYKSEAQKDKEELDSLGIDASTYAHVPPNLRSYLIGDNVCKEPQEDNNVSLLEKIKSNKLNINIKEKVYEQSK